MEKRKNLSKHILKLVKLAKKAYPDLEYTVRVPGYSDTDADIVVRCPEKYKRKIRDAVTDTELDLLVDKDIFIATLVIPSNNRHRKSA